MFALLYASLHGKLNTIEMPIVQGIYLDAFSKVFDILEDSGWSLVREKDKGEADDPSLDDLPNLPYMQQL